MVTKDIVVSRAFVGICHMQLCAPPNATDSRLLEVANRENPSGTTWGWTRVVRDGGGAPVPCATDPARVHFLVSC
jgi:hypothetical protein